MVARSKDIDFFLDECIFLYTPTVVIRMVVRYGPISCRRKRSVGIFLCLRAPWKAKQTSRVGE